MDVSVTTEQLRRVGCSCRDAREIADIRISQIAEMSRTHAVLIGRTKHDFRNGKLIRKAFENCRSINARKSRVVARENCARKLVVMIYGVDPEGEANILQVVDTPNDRRFAFPRP